MKILLIALFIIGPYIGVALATYIVLCKSITNEKEAFAIKLFSFIWPPTWTILIIASIVIGVNAVLDKIREGVIKEDERSNTND